MKLILTTHRKAIAMIELIFAIVIMGIVLLSAPMLLTTATKSSGVAFQQESIAIVATQANALLTYAWDENSTDSASYSRLTILTTQSLTTQLDRNTPLLSSMKRKKASGAIIANATPVSDFGDSADTEIFKDDIDDFHDYNNTLKITTYGAGTTTEENEYMDTNITMNTQVTYGADAASDPTFLTCSTGSNGCAFSNPFATTLTTTTNIKLITTTLTSSDVPDKNISLKSFICNIGSAIPKERTF